MRNTLLALLFPLILLGVDTTAAQTDDPTRIALLLANHAYPDQALPAADPALAGLTQALEARGFDVTRQADTDKAAALAALRSLGGRLAEPGGLGLVYYTGRVAGTDGELFLLPLDADWQRPAGLRYQAIALTHVLEELKYSINDANVLVLDLVPVDEDLDLTAVKALAPAALEQQYPDTLVVLARRDPDAGPPAYTQALNTALRQAGPDVQAVLAQATHTTGVPVQGTLSRSVALAEPPAAAPATPVVDIDPIDQTFWDSIKDSDDPDMYRAYLAQFPDGHYAGQARERLEPAPQTKADSGPDEADMVEVTFWNSVKDSDDPTLLQLYLDEYPQGHFEPLARLRLRQLGAAAPPAADTPAPAPPDATEQAFWDSVKDSDDPALLQLYLDEYPQGYYASQARDRIDTLKPPGDTPASPAVAARSLSGDATGPEPVQAEPTPVPAPDFAREQQIQEYLNRATDALAENYLTTPTDNNAVLWSEQILALDPQHPEARRILQTVADKYLGWAAGNINRGRLDRAARYLDRAGSVRHHATRAQQHRMDDLQQQLVSARQAQASPPAPRRQPPPRKPEKEEGGFFDEFGRFIKGESTQPGDKDALWNSGNR